MTNYIPTFTDEEVRGIRQARCAMDYERPDYERGHAIFKDFSKGIAE